MYNSIIVNQIVEDVPKAAAFYIDKLGFKPVYGLEPDEAGNVDFDVLVKDEVEIMMQNRESLNNEFPGFNRQSAQPSVNLYISVSDIDGLHEDLKGKIEIVSELSETSYGAKEFTILDASGYGLTFSDYVKGNHH